MYEMNDDDDFLKYAEEIEKKKKEEEERKKNGGSTFTYENVKYVAPSTTTSALIRLVGKPSTLRKNPTDALEIQVAKIRDDEGKLMYLYMPTRDTDKDFFIYRVINAVNYPKWVDGEKTFPCQKNHPEVWEMINKCGYNKESNEYKFTKGWTGDSTLLINCIDRMDEWCKENKHTKLLSRNINEGKDEEGKVVLYPEIGIKSYSFLNALRKVLDVTPNWEKFDLGILRSSEKSSPYTILNATRLKKAGLVEDLQVIKVDIDKVSVSDSLTEEELSYERYDLDKLFKTTSYQKILKRLGNSIKKVDAALGRNFYDELTQLAEKEKKEYEIEREAKQQEEANKAAETPVAENIATENVSTETPVETSTENTSPAPETEVKPVRQTRGTATTETKTESFADLLGGWNVLTDEEKSKILNVKKTADGKVSIEYKVNGETIYECPNNDCKCESPETFKHCPACGMSFGN